MSLYSSHPAADELRVSFDNLPTCWSDLVRVLSPAWVRTFSQTFFPGYTVNHAEVVDRLKAVASCPKPTQKVRTFVATLDQPSACVCYTLLSNFFFDGRFICQRKGFTNKDCPTGSPSTGVCPVSEGYTTVTRFPSPQITIDPNDSEMAVTMQLNGIPLVHEPFDPDFVTAALNWSVRQGFLPAFIFAHKITKADFIYIDRTYPNEMILAMRNPYINTDEYNNFVPVPQHSVLECALTAMEFSQADMKRLTPDLISQAALPFSAGECKYVMPDQSGRVNGTMTRGEWVLRMNGEYGVSKPFRNDPPGKWYAITAVLMSLFFSVYASSVEISYNGTNITTVPQLMGMLQTDDPLGIYKVCFGSRCLRRVSNGTEHFCGSLSCNKWPIYPFRCPSVDWQPTCMDTQEECESDCSACGGKFDVNGICWYKYDSAGTDVRTFSSLPGSRMSHNGEITYFNEYGPVTEANATDMNSTTAFRSTIQHHAPNPIPWLIASVAITFASLVLFILEVVLSVRRYYRVEYHAAEEAAELVSPSESVPNSFDPTSWKFRIKDVLLYINYKLLVISLLISFAGVVLVSADESLETWEEYQKRYEGTKWTVPSSCSCTNPNEVTSQLTCKTGCQDDLVIANLSLKMNFGLKTVCQRKKLYVLDRLMEGTCMWCNCAAGCATKRQCMPYMTNNHSHSWWHESTNTPASQKTCGVYCVSNGNLGHWMNWAGSVYDADVCTVSEPTSPGIWGLPDQTAYVYNIKSNLESQTTYIRVYGAYEGLYKEVNGGLGSDRAWIVEPSAIIDGVHLKEGTSAYSAIAAKRQLSLSKDDCYRTIQHELNMFKPTPFNEKCEVTVTFSSMRCFQLDEIVSGECRHINGHYQFRANSSGMVSGRYVSAQFWQDLPDGWTCDASCNAYPSLLPKTNSCAVDMWEYMAPQVNGSNTSSVSWAFRAQETATNIMELILSILVVAAAAILVAGLVSCIVKRL